MPLYCSFLISVSNSDNLSHFNKVVKKEREKLYLIAPLVNRGMSVSVNCHSLSTFAKSIHHVLRDCPVAKKFWSRNPLPCPSSKNFVLI